MLTERCSGVLLHPTSLPGPYGVGEIGGVARDFARRLGAAGQRVWQTLPLNPTGALASPYTATSALASNPLLIALDDLVELDLLAPAELAPLRLLPADRVAYGRAIAPRLLALELAGRRLAERRGDPLAAERDAFIAAEGEAWLNDYALWEALFTAHDRIAWTDWPAPLARRDPAALQSAGADLAADIAAIKALQYLFDRQWRALRAAAGDAGVAFIGDMPIFVAHNSADVWRRPDLFKLDDAGLPTAVAGVPPDYFSEDGQLWGNPLYRWDRMEEEGFAWWIARFRRLFAQVDLVRIDHFRGFAACWETPARETTAQNGAWIPAPGSKLFSAVQDAFPDLPVIAEDLGVITPDVVALRDEFGFPGLHILQFAFGGGPPTGEAHPAAYPANSVCYPGTHDNNTIRGWFANDSVDAAARASDAPREARAALDLMGGDGSDIHWRMIELALSAGSNMAVVALQDSLGLDGRARMNTPGTIAGNWSWRLDASADLDAALSRLAALSRAHGRAPQEPGR
ncbi:MAG: 4-alpha-glucanotransferase [Caulobacterales bacterium]|nr:4-alpha-glucanotransferase [Caulobacterales bacterium]